MKRFLFLIGLVLWTISAYGQFTGEWHQGDLKKKGGVVGTIFVAIGGQEAVDKLWDDMGPRVYIGGGAMLAGVAAGTTDIVLLCVGNRNMRRMVEACDAAGLPPLPAAELTFGPTPSGLGLALRF